MFTDLDINEILIKDFYKRQMDIFNDFEFRLLTYYKNYRHYILLHI